MGGPLSSVHVNRRDTPVLLPHVSAPSTEAIEKTILLALYLVQNISIQSSCSRINIIAFNCAGGHQTPAHGSRDQNLRSSESWKGWSSVRPRIHLYSVKCVN